MHGQDTRYSDQRATANGAYALSNVPYPVGNPELERGNPALGPVCDQGCGCGYAKGPSYTWAPGDLFEWTPYHGCDCTKFLPSYFQRYTDESGYFYVTPTNLSVLQYYNAINADGTIGEELSYVNISEGDSRTVSKTFECYADYPNASTLFSSYVEFEAEESLHDRCYATLFGNGDCVSQFLPSATAATTAILSPDFPPPL